MASELTVCLDGGGFPQMFLVVFLQSPRDLTNLLKGTVSLEVSLYSILDTYVFDAFPQALNIWDYYMSYTGSSPGGLVT